LVDNRVSLQRAAAADGRGRGALPSREALIDALRDRPRLGGAPRRKIGAIPKHALFVIELLEKADKRLQLAELCQLFERRFGVSVAVSTMWRFLYKTLGLSRQAVQRQLPQQALTEKNLQLRRQFVGNWFDGAEPSAIGTNDEQADQHASWRLQRRQYRGISSVDQLFWIDETGCNRHTLLRRHGYGKRNGGGVRCAGQFDGQKGPNHSVIIAVGRSGGVIARQVLVGKEKRGTRRDDFCAFLRQHVAPAMIKSANKAGVPRSAPLLLMMDNASIHKGAVVSEALKTVSPRLGVAYQPPYMPTANPVELVNNQLKAVLRKNSMEALINEVEKRIGMQLMDPQGGVVFDAPIVVAAGNASAVSAVSSSLRQQIEDTLDSQVSVQQVAAFVAHCGWRD
jgi:transposase